MAKFAIVKEKPESLNKDEYFIGAAEFLAEIQANARKAGRGGLTGTNHLRGITDVVAAKYDPENMSAFSIRPHLYEGRAFKTDEELNAIIVDMFKNECPGVFVKYVEWHLKNRPKGTNLVYLLDTGLPNMVKLFQNQGLDQLEKEEKPKRVVGKPAVKNKEAEESND
jgi:hypothetical protein